MILSIKILLVTIMFLLIPQVDDGSALLKQLQQKYEGITDFTADFRMETATGHVQQGKFYYKTIDKFRIELDTRTMISDGESIWNYTPKNNKVIITSIEDNSNSFSINDYVFEFPKKCRVTLIENEDGSNSLLLKPKSTDLSFKELKLKINPNNLIDEIHMTDLMDQGFRVYLSNKKLNQMLSNDRFSFEPTKGIQVIDLR